MLHFDFCETVFGILNAWNNKFHDNIYISGKGESLWDRIIHENPERVKDHSNGDIACDSYNQYKTDVQLLKQLGVSVYLLKYSIF